MRALLCGLVLVFPLLLVGKVHSQTWTRKADMPTLRAAACAAVVNDKIYVVGGTDASFVYTDANEAYDPIADKWETRRPLPTPRSFPSCVAVNDTMYVMGGGVRDSTREVLAYDPVTDTWTRKQDMLSTRYGAAAGIIDNVIYNVGGNHTERNCEAYDLSTDTWTRKRDIPETYGGIAVAAYGGLLYAFGGGFQPTVFSTVFAYDPKTDEWTKKNDMPRQRGWSHPAPVINEKIYVVGGYSPLFGLVLSDVDVYHPVLDTWTTMEPMPFSRAMFGIAVVNDKIYVIGGTADWSNTGATEVWEYDPFVSPGVNHAAHLPAQFVLEQNYPNPFNRTTTISYALPQPADVSLSVADVLGRELRRLASGTQPAGTYEISFDAVGLPSGIYFYRLHAGDYVETKRMVLAK